jgi:hypothetical protein
MIGAFARFRQRATIPALPAYPEIPAPRRVLLALHTLPELGCGTNFQSWLVYSNDRFAQFYLSRKQEDPPLLDREIVLSPKSGAQQIRPFG